MSANAETKIMVGSSPGMEHFRKGMKSGLPIVMGFIPVGFAYGVLAMKAGISPLMTVLMSVMVYAGSAQFIAVAMLGAGMGLFSIVATTFIVNLRHLLMSAALAPYLGNMARWKIFPFTFQLTDESFAVNIARFGQGNLNETETFTINAISQVAWVTGTTLGLVASNLITDVRPIGLDYALPAMFISLLIGQIKDKTHVLVAVISGGISILLACGGVDQFNVILATVIGASIGLGVGKWTQD